MECNNIHVVLSGFYYKEQVIDTHKPLDLKEKCRVFCFYQFYFDVIYRMEF